MGPRMSLVKEVFSQSLVKEVFGQGGLQSRRSSLFRTYDDWNPDEESKRREVEILEDVIELLRNTRIRMSND